MNPSPRKVLLVAANPAVSTTTGWPVGFWAAELTHPWLKFQEHGIDVDIASPNGGELVLDAYSDPRDASGYSKNDLISLGFLQREDLVQKFKKSLKIDSLSLDQYLALIVVGGQSPMFTFKNAKNLQDAFLKFYKTGKPTAALCHGTCLLLYLNDSQDQPFVKGKLMTGFANSEEDYADHAVGQKLMPFRIEDEAKKLGAEFVVALPFQSHAVQDKNLITGQQQNSGRAVAQLVLTQLKKRGDI